CEDSDHDDRSRCGSRPFAFRITLAQSHWDMREYVLAADSREELDEWLCACQQMAANASDKMRQLRSREKQSRIASELSSLVIYCQAVPFNADFELQDSRTSFYEMCSFSESKHDKLVERGLQLFNKRQLSRVYPQASRFTSTNFSPMPMWNSGCHMVALNFQTGDKSMQLNAGRFMANGCCGYVLKPRYLMDETFAIGGAREQQQQ
uniref:Phosphoinositide phospholipase C n=1 Tax=Globodera pallida TaxID=36090 RepID=A0A183CRQ1_GLOPA